MREKCLYSELFWSVFFHIQSEWENSDHFPRSDSLPSAALFAQKWPFIINPSITHPNDKENLRKVLLSNYQLLFSKHYYVYINSMDTYRKSVYIPQNLVTWGALRALMSTYQSKYYWRSIFPRIFYINFKLHCFCCCYVLDVLINKNQYTSNKHALRKRRQNMALL